MCLALLQVRAHGDRRSPAVTLAPPGGMLAIVRCALLYHEPTIAFSGSVDEVERVAETPVFAANRNRLGLRIYFGDFENCFHRVGVGRALRSVV